MSLKRSDLQQVAEELNNELGLDPAINTKSKVKDLKAKIIEAGGMVNQNEDDLPKQVWDTLERLGVIDRSQQEEPEEESEQAEETSETVESSQEPVEEQAQTEEQEEQPETSETTVERTQEPEPKEELSLVDQVQKARKLDDLRALCESNDEFQSLQDKLDDYKGLEGTRQLKADMYKALGVEPPKPASSSSGTSGRSKKVDATERRAFMGELISEGKYTKAQIIEKTMEKFPNISKGSVTTEISDGKNPKYNKFNNLLVIDDKGIVSFKEENK